MIALVIVLSMLHQPPALTGTTHFDSVAYSSKWVELTRTSTGQLHAKDSQGNEIDLPIWCDPPTPLPKAEPDTLQFQGWTNCEVRERQFGRKEERWQRK